MWVRKCVLRLDDWENDLGQWGHLYGVSPVWVRICTISLLDSENDLGQWGHL